MRHSGRPHLPIGISHHPRSACRAAEAEPQAPEEQAVSTSSYEDPSSKEPKNKAFPYPMQKDQQQALLSSIPWPLFYPAMLACLGLAGGAGFGAGRALPGAGGRSIACPVCCDGLAKSQSA